MMASASLGGGRGRRGPLRPRFLLPSPRKWLVSPTSRGGVVASTAAGVDGVRVDGVQMAFALRGPTARFERVSCGWSRLVQCVVRDSP